MGENYQKPTLSESATPSTSNLNRLNEYYRYCKTVSIMKGLKPNEYDYLSDDDDEDVQVVRERTELEDVWEGVVKRWRGYVRDYSLEMLSNYDEGQWSILLPEWVSAKTSSFGDGAWH